MMGSDAVTQLLEMAESAGTLLKQRGETVAVSESSSGGLVAAALLSMPGASAYFIGGGVIYTPKQLQLDHDAGMLYWCDREGGRVTGVETTRGAIRARKVGTAVAIPSFRSPVDLAAVLPRSRSSRRAGRSPLQWVRG